MAKVDVGSAGQGGRSCTGSLISPSWVVTATSCFASGGQPVVAGQPVQPTKVTVGRADLSRDDTGHVVSAISVVPHPGRDVALLKLEAPVSDIVPVTLTSTAPVTGDVLRVAGYGRTGTEWVPNQLHTGNFRVAGANGAVTDIAGSDAGQVGPCKGDAGGPGLRQVAGGVELAAITHTATGQGGCLGSVPDAARGGTQTRVDDIADWIRHTVSTPVQLAGMDKLQIGRFNDDAYDDLLAVEKATGKVFLYAGTPTLGVFQPRRPVQGLADLRDAVDIAAGEFTGDQYDDLVVRWKAGSAFLYPGRAGGFGNSIVLKTAAEGWSDAVNMISGDFTGDGKDDLAVRWTAGSLFVYPGNGAGSIGGSIKMRDAGTLSDAVDIAAGEFTGDQYDDLVVRWKAGSVFLYPGRAGGFGNSIVLTTAAEGWSDAVNMISGDFTGDGKDDLAVRWTAGSLFVYPGNRDGTRKGSIPFSVMQ